MHETPLPPGSLWLSLPLSAAAAEELYDRYLNRNLPASVPSHFFRGGNDKWRAEFKPRDFRRVMARMPAEMFTAFGYAVPAEADLPPAPFTDPPTPVSVSQAAELEAYEFFAVDGPYGIRVTSEDVSLSHSLRVIFADPDLQALFAAGQPRPCHPATGNPH